MSFRIKQSFIYKKQTQFYPHFFSQNHETFFLLKPRTVSSQVFVQIENSENINASNLIQKHSNEDTYPGHDNLIALT